MRFFIPAFFLLFLLGPVRAQPLQKKDIWGKWYLHKIYFNQQEVFNQLDSAVMIKSIWMVNAHLDSISSRYKRDSLGNQKVKTYSPADSLREEQKAIERYHELKEVFFELYQNGTYRQAKLVILDPKKSKFNYGKYTFDVHTQMVKDSRLKDLQLKIVDHKLVLELPPHGKETMSFEFIKK